jgi:hypothetical protein
VGKIKHPTAFNFDYDDHPSRICLRGKASIVQEIQSFSKELNEMVALVKVKRVNDQKFIEIKLEKKDIFAIKRKSCCNNFCLLKLGTQGIRYACKKYF